MDEDNAREHDSRLVEAALAGGPEEFGAIVERYQDAVFAVVLARLRRFHDAEDVAQSVFLDAYERLDRFKEPKRLGAWLRSIAIHKSIDRLRRRKEEVDIDEAGDDERSVSVWRDRSERRDLRDEVMAAIGRLSKTQRETTTLYYINGYSVDEVAAIQEVPAGTVKGRLHDARKRLKEEMIGMVEQVLKSEAPKEDFAERVFKIVNRPADSRKPSDAIWKDLIAEIRKNGTDGVEGFIKALESPQGKTREFALKMLDHARPSGEAIVDLLKSALSDRNKKVRAIAVRILLGGSLWRSRANIGGISEDRLRKEFVPLVIPLLADRSSRVRLAAYDALRGWAEDVPLEAVASAMSREIDPDETPFRWVRFPVPAIGLLKAVLTAREAKKEPE